MIHLQHENDFAKQHQKLQGNKEFRQCKRASQSRNGLCFYVFFSLSFTMLNIQPLFGPQLAELCQDKGLRRSLVIWLTRIKTCSNCPQSKDSMNIKHMIRLSYGILQINMSSWGGRFGYCFDLKCVKSGSFFSSSLIPIKHFSLI